MKKLFRILFIVCLFLLITLPAFARVAGQVILPERTTAPNATTNVNKIYNLSDVTYIVDENGNRYIIAGAGVTDFESGVSVIGGISIYQAGVLVAYIDGAGNISGASATLTGVTSPHISGTSVYAGILNLGAVGTGVETILEAVLDIEDLVSGTSRLFDKGTDNTDNITEGTTNLFQLTQAETKAYIIDITGTTIYGSDGSFVSGASNLWVVMDKTGTSSTVVSDGAGGATVYVGAMSGDTNYGTPTGTWEFQGPFRVVPAAGGTSPYMRGALDLASGNSNIFIGVNAGGTAITSAQGNIGLGEEALSALTDGYFNNVIGFNAGTALTTAGYNVLLGHYTGYALESGNQNVAVGLYTFMTDTSGTNNVVIGSSAGEKCDGGAANVYIGHSARKSDTGSPTGNVFIGNSAGYYTTGDNELFIENSSTDAPLIYGDFATDSLRFGSGTTDVSGASVMVTGAGTTSGETVFAVFSNGGDTTAFTTMGDNTSSIPSGATFYLDRDNGYGIWIGADGKAYIKDATSSRQM